MIPVTKTFLPPQEEYQAVLSRAWEAGWITNRGVLVKELEEKLSSYLQVPNILATTNGTLPLQIAIKALGLKGEIITTPFSYVATTSSIVWEGCKPVFVDIHPEYLTIDETKIEAAITEETSAILATHVFGNPCNVEAIEKLAKNYNLKVIYDAAHCFGAKYKGKSIFEYGDVSTCSFHATKIFHTGEGGALFASDDTVFQKLFYHHNFGHKGQEDFHGLGINAKMSELQAAMGLSVLPYIDQIIENRKKQVNFYNQNLDCFEIKKLKIREGSNWNYSYYPVIFKTEKMLLDIKFNLENLGVFPRRYFYPCLNSLNYLEECEMEVADKISKNILCLPLFEGLHENVLDQICDTIKKNVTIYNI
ncbi:dTDP-4-amino-4,6-dideoxygalactose transaminase [Christiangramia gaetbulicola]|uniref:dTDP-4-amino-4,6-dideoxygalactose transaminase n=1 Tax=Christiangramia gaetbulicola TaxID=703340 RepID=A0A2T6AJT9_9FLAO|nr:DegT/DnrJ/EryC1/StrS family aminotransferase [Christiangramia gaetbulicola]PTX44089.1 dTDP-4-amino-4,6-dideoxygalactose transaminase [Christiangramia gaetbulicola]